MVILIPYYYYYYYTNINITIPILYHNDLMILQLRPRSSSRSSSRSFRRPGWPSASGACDGTRRSPAKWPCGARRPRTWWWLLGWRGGWGLGGGSDGDILHGRARKIGSVDCLDLDLKKMVIYIEEISQSILDFIYGSRHIFCFWGCTFDSRVWSQGFKDPGCQEWWVAGNITWSRDI